MTASEEQWLAARQSALRSLKWLATFAVVLFCTVVMLAMLIAESITSGVGRYPLTAALLAGMMTPIVVLLVRTVIKSQARSDEIVEEITAQLATAVATADEEASRREAEVRRRGFESQLSNALDMAMSEADAIAVVERCLTVTLPGAPAELLLADNSHAHLLRMASVAPGGSTPGCKVDSPNSCPATRRSQTQSFPDSEALDACPKLRGRRAGGVSALCTPVSVMGRTVGVIHATRERGTRFADEAVQDVTTLARLAGARIGLLRVMAETQLQASTDSLTGLLNRRSFEHRLSIVRQSARVVSVVMADVDHFKLLNDTYGHETGDRALRLLASVFVSAFRADDIICRYGGEEFVIALPGCDADSARKVLDATRSKLDAALATAGMPRFTVSFGIVEDDCREDLANVIANADAALFQAKTEGRNSVVVFAPTAVTLPESVPGDAYEAGWCLPAPRHHSPGDSGVDIAR